MAKNIYISRLIIAIFFLGIIYYSAFSSFLPEKVNNKTEENRKFAQMPEFNFRGIKDYPEKFEAYFNDNFGLRNTLISLQHWYKIAFLKISPSSKVIIGKDRWLYYARTVYQYKSPRYFRDQDLEKWESYIVKRMNYLESKGIQYLFVVVPDKISIYPDYVPNKYLRGDTKSALDQFIGYLKANSDLHVIDLTTVLLDSKKRYPVYYQTGTHWNDIGGYFGYHEVLKNISLYSKTISPVDFNKFKINTRDCRGKDLAGMIDQRDQIRENEYIIVPKFDLPKQKKKLPNYLDIKWPKGWMTPYLITCEGEKGTLAVIGDSFFIGQAANFPILMAQHFNKAFFVHRKYMSQAAFEKMVDMETPDIVVEEIIERNILAIPKI